MIWTRAHKARKQHFCSTRTVHCTGVIKPGERYLAHTASPQHDDLGNEGWWHLAECAPCAETYGRPIDPPKA